MGEELIDTNILVYSLDRSAPEEKRETARELVSEAFRRESELHVSTQNLEEFAVVTMNKLENPLPADDVKGFIEEIEGSPGFRVLETSSSDVRNAVKSYGELQDADFWDLVIAATMRRNGVEKVVTENTSDFEEVRGVEAENPFR